MNTLSRYLITACIGCAPLFVSVAVSGRTTNLYVSPTGNDKLSGASEQASFLTLARAQERARQLLEDARGDVVVNLAAGEYRLESPLEFDERDSGRNGFRMIYRSAEGPGRARILGSQVLKGWHPYRDGIWQINLPKTWQFHTLYENGRRAHKARFPNLEPNPLFPLALDRYLVSEDGSTKQSLKNPSRPEGPGWLSYSAKEALPVVSGNETKLHIFLGGTHAWFREVYPVTSIDRDTRRIVFARLPTQGLYLGVGAGARFFLEDDLSLLDAPEEFFWDQQAGILYYMPAGGADPDTREISCSTLNRLLQIKGAGRDHPVRDLILEGLSLAETDNSPPEPLWGFHGLRDGALIWMTNCERVQIQNCLLINSGRSGIVMVGHNLENSIDGCFIRGMALNGISVSNRALASDGGPTLDRNEKNRISNTYISHVGELYTYAECVSVFNASYNEVSHCEFSDSVRYAITLRGNTGPQYGPPVSNNFPPATGNWFHHIRVSRCGQDAGDMGALHAANLNNPGGTHINTFEQIVVTDTFATPSMKDLPPDGVFLDWPRMAMHQVFKNVSIVRSQGFQLRSNKPENSDSAQTDNVSWKPGFRDELMDYAGIGLTKAFPPAYRKLIPRVIPGKQGEVSNAR